MKKLAHIFQPSTSTPDTTESSSAGGARIWRIGLLLTTISLGILLVLLGVFEYRDAKENGRRITQAQALHMMLGFQKQMHPRQPPTVEAIEALYDMLQDQGVHRVALYEDDRLVHGFGTATQQFNPEQLVDATSAEPIAIRFVTDNLVHARIELPSDKGRGPRRMGYGRRARRTDPDLATNRSVLLELVPTQAIAMRERAFQIMLVDILAALILMGTAIVFWRLSVKQEALRLQLEKDKQLKLLGQMSAVLGHELKNTIASVKGHSQLLVEKLAGTPHESNAALIEKDTVYLQNLTEQMLAFARTGAMHIEKVYLDDLAEAAVTFSEPSAEATRVTINIGDGAPAVYLDRHKMQQVITNLINNAKQAGATEITLSLAYSNGPTITVADNGDGMDEDQRERLFEPFFTTRAKGTGLGLALARRIIDAHGGTIEVHSTSKRGTTFVIKLPPVSIKENQ